MWIKFRALILYLFCIVTAEKGQREDHHSSDQIEPEEGNGSELIEMNSSKTEASDIVNPNKCVINENESDFLKNSNLCKACNNIERKVDSEHFCQIYHSSKEMFF